MEFFDFFLELCVGIDDLAAEAFEGLETFHFIFAVLVQVLKSSIDALHACILL